MYNLPPYKEKNPRVIMEFIERYPFAFLIGCDTEKSPVATQVPVFIEEKEGRRILRGHIMKNTDHHKAFVSNENVLVVFTGPHTYVSGSWYTDTHIASTWNYMSVHIKGRIRILDDAALEDILRKTSLYFENQDEKSPTVFDNLPQEFKQKVMPAIVAFEILVTEMDNVFKLSQNRDAESYSNIIGKLKEQGGDAEKIAGEMEMREKELFPGEE